MPTASASAVRSALVPKGVGGRDWLGFITIYCGVRVCVWQIPSFVDFRSFRPPPPCACGDEDLRSAMIKVFFSKLNLCLRWEEGALKPRVFYVFDRGNQLEGGAGKEKTEKEKERERRVRKERQR